LLWDKTKQGTVDILTLRDRAITSFLTPTAIGGRRSLSSDIAREVTHPFEKRHLQLVSAYNASTVRDSEKSSITMNSKSTAGFPTSYIDGVRALPLSLPKGGSKSDFCFFKIQFQSNKVCYKVFCVKTSSSKVLVQPFSHLTVHRRKM